MLYNRFNILEIDFFKEIPKTLVFILEDIMKSKVFFIIQCNQFYLLFSAVNTKLTNKG
jgi:hypothetical protein